MIIAAALALVYPVGRWILRPIDQAAEAVRQPTRYRIVDFFCLIVEMQLVFAVPLALNVGTGERIASGVILGVIVFTIWFKGVSTLSHAGIEDPWRRAAFNWYVLPVTYVGAIAYAPLLFAFIGEAVRAGLREVPWWLWTATIVCPVALLISKRIANWILVGAAHPVDLEETHPSEQLELP